MTIRAIAFAVILAALAAAPLGAQRYVTANIDYGSSSFFVICGSIYAPSGGGSVWTRSTVEKITPGNSPQYYEDDSGWQNDYASSSVFYQSLYFVGEVKCWAESDGPGGYQVTGNTLYSVW